MSIYVNGALSASATKSLTPTYSAPLRIGVDGDQSFTNNYFNGILDEARVSDIARSADWIAAEYNNQKTGGTFYSIGAEQGGGGTATPTFSPAAGTYSTTQSVTISTTTTGATIRYTTDGTTPSETLGTVYSGPVTVSATTTIKAIAYESGLTDSGVATAAYTINAGGGNQYSFNRTVTIDHTQVPNTDQTNFPVLFNTTDALLKTVANGGHVQSANGYDIIFTSDAAGTVKLDHEIESYNASTGQFIAWVRIPTLSHTTDTMIYLFYGNSSVTTSQENKTGVWNSDYKGVWHLPNGSTLTANDSTGNGNNGSVTSATATAGQIDGGGSFDGSSANINLGTSTTLQPTTGGTVSIWLKANSFRNCSTAIANQDVLNDRNGYGLYFYSSGVANFELATGSTRQTVNSSALSSGQWYYLVGTWNSTTVSIYVNGALSASATKSLTPTYSAPLRIGVDGDQSFTNNYFNGILDEARVSDIARSADWIAAEYNNQKTGGTFYSIGAEQGGVALPTFSPPAGTYSSTQTVTISTTTSGASIRYTTDGSTPSETAGTLYSGPVTMSSTTTIKAIAYKSGMTDSAVASAAYTFSVPTITSVSPASAEAGVSVTISGSGFGTVQGTGAVSLGTRYATVVSWSATQIVATVATGSTSGTAQVQQGGTLSNSVSFSVINATITSASPASGLPGTQVTITGSGFGAAQGSGQVWLGTASGAVQSWSDTQVVALVAAGSATGKAQVLQGGVWSNTVVFAVNTPTLTSISPASGLPGTAVTFTGSGFGSTQSSGIVWLGSTTGVVLSWSDTLVVAAVAPTALTGIARIEQNGVWSKAFSFTVPGGSGVTLVPNLLNMTVGDTHTIEALGSNGQSVTGLTWTTSDSTIVSLSSADPPLLTAVAAGHVTITAGGASADVTVSAGALPLGTVLWSNPGNCHFDCAGGAQPKWRSGRLRGSG